MNSMKKSEKRFLYKTLLVSAIFMAAIIYFILTEIYISQDMAIEKIMQKLDANMIEQTFELIEKYKDKVPKEKIAEIKKKSDYALAINAHNAGDTKNARSIFKTFADDKDVWTLFKECDYIDAMALLSQQKYEEASYKFVGLSAYKDSQKKLMLCKYNIAKSYYLNEQYLIAFDLFKALGDYEDASDITDEIVIKITGISDLDKAYELLTTMSDLERSEYAAITLARKNMPKQALAVGADFTIVLKKDNTVIATGSNEFGQCDVESWSDIIARDAGTHHTLALKADGTVVATGLNEHGQCDVDGWKNVVQISAGAYDSYGLCSDGTAKAVDERSG